MSIVAGFWATAGVFALVSFTLAMCSIGAEYVRTSREFAQWASTFLALAVASSITAIWLAVAGL